MACEYRTSITQPSCDKVAKISSSKPKNLTSICIGSPPASTRWSDLARTDFSRDDKTHGEGRCRAICVLSPFLSRGDRCAQVACGRPERGERNLRYRRPHRSARTRAHHDHCCGRGAGGTELTCASKNAWVRNSAIPILPVTFAARRSSRTTTGPVETHRIRRRLFNSAMHERTYRRNCRDNEPIEMSILHV